MPTPSSNPPAPCRRSPPSGRPNRPRAWPSRSPETGRRRKLALPMQPRPPKSRVRPSSLFLLADNSKPAYHRSGPGRAARAVGDWDNVTSPTYDTPLPGPTVPRLVEACCSMVENLETRSAAAIGRLIAKGNLDPVEATQSFVESHQAPRPRESVVHSRHSRTGFEGGRSQPQASPRTRAAGPLDGVPFAWKDLVDMAGERTTAGSALFADSPPKEKDAPIVANLAAAGIVALGKTNLWVAFWALGLNPHFGTPRNPHDAITPRIAGGSSSGAAVAVAGGLAPCAIGSDTGGSIRAAAFCGSWGSRPAKGGSTSAACFRFHTPSTRSARWPAMSKIAC